MGMTDYSTFTLTENHIKLLRAMYVGWQDCETGAPEIDPKRPYGNSYVAGDIHEILTDTRTGDYELTEKEEEAYLALHRLTEYALQIVLATGKMLPGKYEKAKYSRDWKYVSP